MQTTLTSSARLLAAHFNKVLWLRVEGKGSFAISPQLQRYALNQIEEGERELVIDLERCPSMDSTFMGTLTGLAVRLMDLPGGCLQVVNANERNLSLLENLGLDHIFSIDRDGSTRQEERRLIAQGLEVEQTEDVCASAAPVDKKEACGCMLEAHEHLAKARPANAPKFQDVIACLKRELESHPA